MSLASIGGRASLVALLVRAIWGTALAAEPRIVVKHLGGPTQPRAVPIVRMLGVRHLVQCVSDLVGGPRVVRLGVGIDLLHAASDIGFAAIDGRWRRAARSDAGITLGLASLGLVSLGASRTAAPEE